MSRIEDSLLAKIENSSSTQERAILISRLAIYYFHKGDSEKANKLVEDVRAWMKINSSVDVMVHINLAEAADLFQSARTKESIQKAKRAYALSSAAGKKSLVALSAIWLAHLEYHAWNYTEAIGMIRVYVENSDEAGDLAETRYYMMFANILAFCGKTADAKLWYSKARAAAVREGDEIAIGQIIYNSAVFQFHNIRLSHIRGDAVEEDIRLIELMIGSSSHYDVGVRSSAFKSLLPMLNAQLLTFKKDFKSSARIFARWLQSSEVAVDDRLSTVCRADFALSLANIGDLSGALEQFSIIDAHGGMAVTPDDAAIIFHQLALLCAVAGDDGMSEVNYEKAKAALKKHEGIQREVLALIENELGLNFN
jgi:tetratricopeptide (TPR) repeat protein